MGVGIASTVAKDGVARTAVEVVVVAAVVVAGVADSVGIGGGVVVVAVVALAVTFPVGCALMLELIERDGAAFT